MSHVLNLLFGGEVRNTIFIAMFLFPLTLAAENARVSKELKIGAILILSGESSAQGLNSQRGATLAMEEINASGGINGKGLTIQFEDEPNASLEKAVTAYHKLVKIDKVRVILGPNWLGEVQAVAPLAERDKVFLITPSTSAPSILKYQNVFSTWADPIDETNKMAKLIFEKHQTVSVLSGEEAWESTVGIAFKSAFTELGGKVLTYDERAPDATDVKSEVLRVKRANPEAVFISSFTLLGKYTKALKQLQVNVPFFGIELDQATVDSSDGAAEGLVFIGPATPPTDSSFNKKFHERFGANPDVPASQAYDAINMLAAAIRSRGEDVSNIEEYFKSFGTFQGATGTITRNAKSVEVATTFFQVKSGKYSAIQ